MALVDRSFIGKGIIYLRERSGTGGLMPVGNCSELSVSFEEDEKVLKDYKSPSGGNANTLSTISNFAGNIVAYDFTSENLALALRGSVAAITAGAVAEEAHSSTGDDGEFIPFDFPADKTQTITVVTTADGALTEGTDYEITNGGILVIGDGAIDATGVKISYTKAAGEVMQALVEAGKEFELFFDGLNEAQSGKAVVVRIHRLKFSPAQGINFIGDEFGELPLGFSVLSDASITANGVSKFMKVMQVA